MTTEYKFPCAKCGLCCHDVRGLDLPLAADGRRCAHLKHNNLCAIYDERPPVCRVRNHQWAENLKMCMVLQFNALKKETS